MTIRYLTFVFMTRTQGSDFDIPVLAIHTDTEQEVAHLPFVEQLLHHAEPSEITPIARGYSEIANHRDNSEPRDHRLAPVAVSDEWLRVMRKEYDQQAKIVMILEPITSTEAMSSEIPATGAPAGVHLPDWLGALFTGQLHMATQDVPVVDDLLMTIAAFPHVYRSVDEWASTII
ncbi:hypothetical protein MOQ72_27075 [Saccharopolyspora sp. K220]|uniref:hypothetical protein n=1 Tax=Saccharopolyspora soli TaxID=2926618 RepID=UPI001F59AD9B|nr:hypothetical protein [Saccharopolyspora soli]MCI2421111.1 hypothetical protein [Saccharopolyspora soli]